ncbi:oxygen-regulated protein 1 [Mastacembelus armatus]|uniref:oxygen-regulated protein 1 n=1 Tax=Mastacembelus armatus TaxID=205130 RepID=UPI000E4638F2|nr:oxygen-regulated protein 1-like [Mastacembelus armatus]
MSNTTIQEPPLQALSSGSGQTLPTRPLQPNSDPTASKRVCFYKSGDYQFSGHRMVINARTFKTFDALLDALSKKVPLPFGVRTITTPRGTHLVRGLDDLQDGGCYVCSDQKRVKPLNLDEVNRRQVPWNTTRLLSAGGQRRRQGLQFGRRNEVSSRPAKVTERVAVRTPKRLVVIKNKDPTVKRTIVLQRRTAPTFDALLDYLSQILQFPVLKLYSTDGRRVDGLAALILCSGVIVAAGNEPFRLGNYSFHRTGQMAQSMYIETVEPSTLQPNAQNNKSFSSGRGSRNFSLSSERYIVNQINKSRNGSIHAHQHQHNGSFEKEVNQHYTSMETCGEVDNEHHTCIVPQDDDIEKSFRVNQDGSMTVEMKVRLTIKEEELLHWTTTLSRSSFSKRTARASISESGNSSPNLNNAISQESSSISDDETKEENHPSGKGVGFNSGTVFESYTSTALGKTTFKRTPTPGPRYVKKTASVESVKKVTESGVQENILGHYSYMDRTVDGESSEGYCIVSHNRSSNRPIPKPRKTASAGASNKDSHSSMKSSGVAEVLQIQNNGMEITETVMHIYESQGCYDNYFANEEYSADGLLLHDSTAQDSKPSTESRSHSSSNDCDIDCSWQPPAANSLERQEEEMLSLSSEPVSATHKITNNLSLVTDSETQTATNSQIDLTVNKEKSPKGKKNKKMTSKNNKSSTSTSSSDKKQKQKESVVSLSQNSKQSSPDKLSSSVSLGKKSLSSSESAKNGQKDKGPEKKEEKHQSKKLNEFEKAPKKDSALSVNDENLKNTPPKRQGTNKATPRDNGHNVNTPTVRPQMKKNMSEILQPKKSLLSSKKTVSKPKSMTENIISSPKKTLELSESVSMPSLNPTPSDIHQYVENWLENVSPDQMTEYEPDGEFSEESHEAEDIENIEEQIEKKGEEEEESEVVTENDVEGYVIEETDEGEEVENIVEEQEEEEKEEDEEEEEEAGVVTENNPEEKVVEGIKETEEEEEVQNAIEEGQDEEEGEVDVVTEGGVEEEEAMTASEGTNEEKEVENTIEEVDEKEGEEEIDVVTEEMDEEEVKSEVGSEEINEEEEEEEEEDEEEEEKEEEGEQEEEHYGEDGIENTTEKRTMVVTDEEEEEEEPDNEIDEEEINDEVDESRKAIENIKDSLEESVEESDVEEEMETQENIKEKREDDEEKALNEELVQEEKQEEKQDLSNKVEEVHVTKDVGGWKNVLEEASYWQQQSSSYEANTEQNTESPTKYSLNGQCEDDKDDGTEAFNGLDTDEGEGHHEDRGSNLSHPVEVSQELLDFINSALQSSSLIFTYDARGNIKIEPDYAQVAQTLQTVVPKNRKDSLYGLNCLPSPSTSDLSDYRPETTESGGYNTQDSLDIVTESSEEASDRPFPVYRHKTHMLNGRADVTQAKSKLSVASNSEISQSSRLKSAETFSSHDSGAKTSREDLSYFSAESSLKADAEAAPEATQCVFFTSGKDSTDGVLIDQGRWLLKENHLIRKSPPLSLGMYGHLDSTSIDTCQENSSEDTPPHYKTMHNPLAAISSSELEEMAKPPTPKCTYYNMPHGSDSDPFLDNCSVKSGKKDSSVKGRGFRVSPTIDTSKTCANKNGSLSSFASVELKMPDRKVHPEGESSAVTQARRTSSGGGHALQAQDSLDTMRTRCGQYCPIL